MDFPILDVQILPQKRQMCDRALRRQDVGTVPAGYANRILTASESHFKMRQSMGLLYVPCQLFVREGEGCERAQWEVRQYDSPSICVFCAYHLA
jgi:hypothetical protein